jgi:pyrophosphatase PpaX
MPRYPTVLFDLDGTLIDSIGLIVDSFHHTFAHLGLPAQSDEAWLAGIGRPLRATFAPYARDDAEMEAIIAVYRAYNIEHHDARVRPYPGVVAAVRALAAAGVRMGVVTSKNRQGTQRGLLAAGLTDVLAVRVCVDDVVHGKPHREPVDRAVALLGGAPGATLFVGDSVHDMESGRAAEVSTGAALWGPFQRHHLEGAAPHHWLEAPEQIVALALGAG